MFCDWNLWTWNELVGSWSGRLSLSLSYLCFSQHEWSGHFKAFGSGQVLVEFKLVLQLQQLLTGKSGAGPPALPQQTRLRARCRRRESEVISLWLHQVALYFISASKSSLIHFPVEFLCLTHNLNILKLILKYLGFREDLCQKYLASSCHYSLIYIIPRT